MKLVFNIYSIVRNNYKLHDELEGETHHKFHNSTYNNAHNKRAKKGNKALCHRRQHNGYIDKGHQKGTQEVHVAQHLVDNQGIKT